MKPEVKEAVEATVLEPSTAPTDIQLWGVYGPDCFPTVFACKLKDYPDAHRAIWGYSVYEGEPGYRTLGVDVDKGSVWPRDRNLRLFRYRQQAFDYIASLFPEPDALSPPSALDGEGVVERLEEAAQRVLDFCFKQERSRPLVSIPRSTEDVDALLAEAAATIRTQAAALQSAKADARVWHNALDTACVILGVQASGSPGEMLSAIRAHDEARSARATEAERQRDEARAGERNMAEHVGRIAAEANDAFEAAESLDEFWEACGYPGNRGTLTPAEQVASIIRERDEAEARALTAEARLTEAEEALKPFASISAVLDEFNQPEGEAVDDDDLIVLAHGDGTLPEHADLCAGDFCRAARALSAHNSKEERGG